MWKYQTPEEVYNDQNELYHYGVIGMKWGRRKGNVGAAIRDYKQAGSNLGYARRKRLFSASSYIAGSKNERKRKAADSNIKSLEKKRQEAAYKVTDTQAKNAYNKVMKKTGNKERAKKAEMKVYTKSFGRNGGGLVGSIADESRKGSFSSNRDYYNHISATKGRKYADAVEKKYGKKITRDLVGSAAALVGLAIVEKKLLDRM